MNRENKRIGRGKGLAELWCSCQIHILTSIWNFGGGWELRREVEIQNCEGFD